MTTTFAQRGIGDALVTFESEVPLITREFGPDFEPVYPEWTVLAENPVSVVDKVVDRRGTRQQAEDYCATCGPTRARRSPCATTCGRGNRSCWRGTPRCFRRSRPSPSTSCSAAGTKAQKTHFDDGGLYDQIIAATGKR